MTPRTRSFGALAAMLAIHAVVVSPAQEGLPLPEWDGGGFGVADGPGAGFNNLLPPPPESNRVVESGPPLEDTPPELAAVSGELAPHDLALFLHGSVLKPGRASPEPHAPTAAVALRDLPQEILQQAYRAEPREYLIDPQGLVPEMLKADLRRLLEFHGGDARVKLFVLVMDANQKLPERALLDQIAQGTLTRQDACLAVYPLGEPWRTRFLMSRSVHEAVAVQSLTELAEDCTQDALKAGESGQQLQRFAIRLSTRLFWLEKSLPAPVAHPPAPLQEVVQRLSAPAVPAEAGGRRWTPILAWSVLLGLTGGTGWMFWRGRRRREEGFSHVWMLPEVETPPRLGGNFSGGTSAVIHYGPRQGVRC